jgi:hypothetical protein
MRKPMKAAALRRVPEELMMDNVEKPRTQNKAINNGKQG